MSEASQKVLAWREAKRRDGYEPLTVWLPSEVKHRMTALAYRRREEVAEMLVTAFLAWEPAQTSRKERGTSLSPREIRAIVREEFAALQEQPPGDDAAPLPDAAAPAPPGEAECPWFDASKYVLGKLCPKRHAWGRTGQSLLSAKGRACLECNRARKRRVP